MENVDNNIYGDIEVKKTIYVIIFSALLVLTGCDMKTVEDENIKKDQEILRSEQMDLLDLKLFATMEKVLGIHFTNYRLVTLQKPVEKQEGEQSASGSSSGSSDGSGNSGGGGSSGGGGGSSAQQSMSNEQNQTVEITEIVDDNTVFEKNTEPDWERAQQYIRQVSDIFIDIQIELSKLNISQEEINMYGQHISNIVSDVADKDKEKAITDLETMYKELYTILTKVTQDEKTLTTRKLYYDLIILLLYLEQEEEEKFNTTLETVKQDVSSVQNVITSESKKYILQRISMLVQNIDYTKYNDAKLKIIMSVNSMPVLEYKTEKAS